MKRSVHWGLGFAVGVFVACQSEQDCDRGTEGCPCHDGNVCLQGLVCLSSHCVDPNWTPGESGPSADSADGADGADGSSSHDNVAACEALLADLSCGDFDFTQIVDCSVYEGYVCDVTDYFDCLRDNIECVDGFPDTSVTQQCSSLATCGG
jgi:hypothetical protein